MKNIRLLIEYDGTDYCGWQRQPHCPTIQQTLEDILEKIHGHPVSVYGASRTDSGVHAKGQVANFSSDAAIDGVQWSRVLNYYLPLSIRILESVEAEPRFHAQKYALGKTYDYRILNRSVNSALDRRVHFFPARLDWTKIQEALPYFLGEKDFRVFQAARADVLTTVRRIEEFRLIEEGAGFYTLRIRGNGFLKQMVRSIVGTLIEVGLGRREPASIEALIAAGDRVGVGHTAPAQGLTLVKVFYPEGGL